MRIYDLLDRIFPGSYAAKFGLVLGLVLACPLLAALLIPPNGAEGSIALFSATVMGGMGAFRAILGLLSPLSRVAASLQRIEAGHRARLLPVGHRDEMGFLMECTNRLAAGLETHLELASEKADRDAMTGLLNRRGIERWIPSLQLGAFIMIGLDHFEQVQNSHGRHAGDSLLIQVADLLGATVRQRDILARIGGGGLPCLPSGSRDGTGAADGGANPHGARRQDPPRRAGHDGVYRRCLQGTWRCRSDGCRGGGPGHAGGSDGWAQQDRLRRVALRGRVDRGSIMRGSTSQRAAGATNGSSPTIPLKNNALQVRKLASKNGVSAFVHGAFGNAAGAGRSLASFLRFCAVAARRNSSLAPFGPRSRSRLRPSIRFRWANSISTFFRSFMAISYWSVLARSRAV
ncbi:diguanylate cyclase (GGDEF) domain-containing protein [Aliiruegeria lutimaris]|uniref:diguanylate cyclase n=1 Tax=Aliiruegeria lutimaris TaxID=571298 RepID=A0A1G9C3I8_9RHOB|nr:diguanylate cyclase (GGDEF) domain-containing protein [Aliiruegeria lutimaris]